MKNAIKVIGFALFLCFPAAFCHATDVAQLTNEVANAITSFKQADSGMTKLFNESAGYAVFPDLGKGGLLIGGGFGEGLVYERGTLVGRTSLTQVTIGAQLGGQMFSKVIFFENRDVLENFKRGNWEMSGQVSAVIAAEGVSKDARFVDGVLVFTKPLSGLMVEASVGGQKFTYDPIQPSPAR